MSALADEVVKNLARRQGERRYNLTADKVDEILEDLDIPAVATKAVPVPLRATRIYFSGTKRLDPTHPDAEGYAADEDGIGEEADAPMLLEDAATVVGVVGGGAEDSVNAPKPRVRLVRVPFRFEWEPQTGVNGIGSGRNLRGKSTVLNVLMWSLTGRCVRFQPDIRRWIEHVEVDWTVGAERLRVSFDARDGEAKGQVVKLGDVGMPDKITVLGEFDGDEFEGVMGSLMMARLRLEHIPVWTDAKARVHAWPSYSSSFVVRANQLDPIVGNEQTIGVRMMQMFVGTDWAPAQAAAMTARRGMDTERSAAAQKAQAAGETVEKFRQKAQSAVDDVKKKIAALPAGTPDVKAMVQFANRASALSRRVHALEGRLIEQSSLAETARQQLKAVKARIHTDYEDALATKFFHRMRPTVCPRCAAEVTAERQAAEPDNHECSVCASDLNLEALKADVIVAASVSKTVASALVAGAAGDDSDGAEADDGPQDDVEAAEAAVVAAEAAVATLVAEINELTAQRDEAAAKAEAGGDLLSATNARRALELQLARAEGALAALTQTRDPKTVDPVDPTVAAVVDAAEQVLKKWVKDDQDPLLRKISADIERLAVSFGADSLSDIRLDGAANMSMLKNGDPATYSGITEGEKLRVKIATAIALIKHGYAEGIGRHPGFLVLDSPAAEEMPESDLATMVEALQSVAEEADMQIFVATRNAAPLVELLPEANRVVAEGDDYVW
ncbi:ATP-binding protein [Actinoallomurus rhizosphaericola]|uniref:ATP-binding protein n=1 Tax=Actinoallomurus rhizosphaericola TaxID=2952536 RepID=UPI002091FB17|nr:ATP-binding protein [Actinoallomurus rhizosphaericola]MCO5995744.1 ATP-binding protein [Actinoallomurus rhizosphaericola]